ncbi:MAG TPA: 16S rRNA (guanine(966)-N(2))-methyltransferase RsmD [Longimicrobiales bacterium]|nr:16S rRNA (guanine(966)-N(2))-methyltransferase RsmD [Longimicrobiales bacterium]
MRIIAGRWRGRTIQAPAAGTRPTTDRVREAWMSMMQAEIPDARVLDLFAGSGALGLETLSRGARHAHFVERAATGLRTLRANIRKLEADTLCTVIRADAMTFAPKLGRGEFDLVVADPPYGSGEAAALAALFLRSPFAKTLWIEHRVSDPLPEAPGSDTRRYGDTLLTRYEAPA